MGRKPPPPGTFTSTCMKQWGLSPPWHLLSSLPHACQTPQYFLLSPLTPKLHPHPMPSQHIPNIHPTWIHPQKRHGVVMRGWWITSWRNQRKKSKGIRSRWKQPEHFFPVLRRRWTKCELFSAFFPSRFSCLFSVWNPHIFWCDIIYINSCDPFDSYQIKRVDNPFVSPPFVRYTLLIPWRKSLLQHQSQP